MDKIIMQDPEIHRQIGELTGRFNTFEKNMSREFGEVKQAIKDQSVVPYSVYEARVSATDLIHKEHSDDIKTLKGKVSTLEDINLVRSSTTMGKLSVFLDSALVKIIGTGVVGVVLFAIYLNYQAQIDSISEKVDNVTRKDIIIEQRK